MGLPKIREKLNLSEVKNFNKLSLVILTGNDKGKVIEIDKPRIVIGRDPHCDIQIQDLKASREHIEIVMNHGSIILTDLKSQNGVLVNRKKVVQTPLLAGDKITIGQTWFRVVNKAEESPANTKIKKTNKAVFYILLGLVLIVLMLPDNEITEDKTRKGDTVKKFSEVNSELVKKINAKQQEVDKELNKNIDSIIKRGLRELREKNYYRATLEFTHALDLSPNDSQSAFYLRRTRDELDQVIRELNIAALREIESLHYQRAVVSYCAILRLLYNFKQDKRVQETENKLRDLEVKMGKEKGEISCY